MPELTTPRPLVDVVSRFDAKTPIGSVLRTAEWEKLPQGLRDRAMFSAGVESVRWLSKAQDDVSSILQRARSTNAKGESYWSTDRSKIVADLRKMGREIGITHPDGRRTAGGAINEQDLTDPLSIRRLKLIVNTQMELAYGYGDFLAAHDPAVLDVWPCWELVRISPRVRKRDWQTRWTAANGTLHEGRMIARKDSGIWVALSRFGNPYPPFDFSSGMGVEEVMRDEAVALGVIQDADVIESQVQPFNQGLEASVKNLSPKERTWLKQVFGNQIIVDGDTVKWNDQDEGPPAPPKPKPKPPTKPKKIPPTPAPQPAPVPATSSSTVPTGTPVSTAALVDPKMTRSGRFDVTEALRNLDSVHGDGVLPQLPFNHKVGRLHIGSFWSNPNHAVSIGLHRHVRGDHAVATVTHEVGHWLDHSGMPGSGFASTSAHQAGHAMHAWWQAVTSSQAYASITQRLPTTKDGVEHRDYLLRPQELWARCYAQFIAEESRHRGLNIHIDRVLTAQTNYWPDSQWQAQDFAPVRKAMRELFVSQGWMK